MSVNFLHLEFSASQTVGFVVWNAEMKFIKCKTMECLLCTVHRLEKELVEPRFFKNWNLRAKTYNRLLQYYEFSKLREYPEDTTFNRVVLLRTPCFLCVDIWTIRTQPLYVERCSLFMTSSLTWYDALCLHSRGYFEKFCIRRTSQQNIRAKDSSLTNRCCYWLRYFEEYTWTCKTVSALYWDWGLVILRILKTEKSIQYK